MKKTELKIYEIRRKPRMLTNFFSFLQLVMENNMIILDSFCQIARKYYKRECQFRGASVTTDSAAACLPRSRNLPSLEDLL